MFRLIRLCILLGVAFVAGIMFERSQARERCTGDGGTWTSTLLCVTEEGSNG